MSRFRVGDGVQTPHGKGVVREVRNGGRLLVHVQQRAVVVAEDAVTPLHLPPKGPRRTSLAPPAPEPTAPPADAPLEVDLHGLTVDEATTRIDTTLDLALRAGHAALRFIHGRSGGRLRAALHARLSQMSSVRSFRLDPRNPGVTIVSF